MKDLLDIFRDISKEIMRVEEELGKVVQDAQPIIRESSIHLITAGGKRLRPAFSFLGGKFYNYDFERVLPLAVALELVHMATLVHDDVVDSSMTRRNVPTIKAMWGNKISTHLGDYLFGISLELIARYNNPVVSHVLADTSAKMCEGEIQQLATANRADQMVRDYFYRIKRKTALLIAISCQLGAVVCGAPESIYMPLRRYGHCIGMAFQITDDILDLVADQKQLGKPIGSDLKQGVVTLPLIYALKHSPQKDRLVETVTSDLKNEEQIKEACRLIIECGGVDYAGKVARKYVTNAWKHLDRLPDTPARDTLRLLSEFVALREF